ncbi:MAG: transporter substrate-binding domain-containing protein [Pseudomonadota bacterium]
MKILVSALCVALMALAQSAWAQEEALELASTEYPPFYGSELDDNGFVSEIVVEAFNRVGYGSKIDFLPWRRAYESGKAGNYDAVFTMWWRPERAEDYHFSDPLPSNELVFVVRKGDGEVFEGYESLKGKTIGFVRDYAAPPGFEQAGLRVSESRDDEENLRKLLRGRVDAVLADRIVAQHIINTEMPDEETAFAVLSPPVHIDIQYLAIPKVREGGTELMAAFNSALADMTSDGTLEAIMAKHGF